MHGLSPETEQQIAEEEGIISAEESDEDIDIINDDDEEPHNLSDFNNIHFTPHPEPMTLGNTNIAQQETQPQPSIPLIIHDPRYQDLAIYPDESEALEVLAFTWNFMDRRQTATHLFPLPLFPEANKNSLPTHYNDESQRTRDFWLMEIPRKFEGFFNNEGLFNYEEECARKRRFDTIEEIHTEVAKCAKRTLVKLGILGNTTRKRDLTTAFSLVDSNCAAEDDPGPRNKKQKEPSISENVVDNWIEDLAAMFGACILVLGEVVPKTAPKSP